MLNDSIARENDIFQQVRKIPFSEAFKAFYNAEIGKNKAHCPFHQDKNPSLHVYPDGYKCFGCGAAGDSVNFVAALYDLRPLDAARAICEKFGIPYQEGPLSRQDKLNLAQAKAHRLRERRLQEAFDTWCKEAGTRARVLAEALKSLLDEKGVEIDNDILPMIHLLPLFEFWADTLNMGTDEQKLELYGNGDLRRWLLCN